MATKKNLSKNNIIKQNSSLKKKRDDFIALTPTYGYILTRLCFTGASWNVDKLDKAKPELGSAGSELHDKGP